MAKYILGIKKNGPSRVANAYQLFNLTASHAFVGFLPRNFNYQPVKMKALKKADYRISARYFNFKSLGRWWQSNFWFVFTVNTSYYSFFRL